MIRMSKETDYGMILLACFAAADGGARHSARELAEETRLPLPMVSKILKMLTREGLLASHRGVKGGYSLIRRPERISVAEIVDALEGRIAVTTCIETPGECHYEPVCQLRTNWERINDTVMRALGTITLSDMAGPLPDPLVYLEGGESGSSLTTG